MFFFCFLSNLLECLVFISLCLDGQHWFWPQGYLASWLCFNVLNCHGFLLFLSHINIFFFFFFTQLSADRLMVNAVQSANEAVHKRRPAMQSVALTAAFQLRRVFDWGNMAISVPYAARFITTNVLRQLLARQRCLIWTPVSQRDRHIDNH